MNVLVTGAAGFIGGRLCAKLLSKGHRVTGLDNFSDYYDVQLKKQTASQLIQAGVTFIEGDLNLVDLTELVDVDVVFHQAGQPGVRNSWGKDFSPYVEANISATQKILEAVASRNRETKIVYASSSSVYGSAESFPTMESTVPRPKSPYGVTKLAAEHLCSLYAENYGLDVVSLRYFTVYGPRQRPDMAFSKFTRALLTGGLLEIFGSGKQVRDFTYVDDIVDANIVASQSKLSGVFNVSGGGQHSVLEVINLLGKISGLEPNVKFYEETRGDVERTCGDNSLFRKNFDWVPRTPISLGLTSELEWMAGLLDSGSQSVWHD